MLTRKDEYKLIRLDFYVDYGWQSIEKIYNDKANRK